MNIFLMKTIDLIPEQIVEDFGIKGFIDTHLERVVEKIESCDEAGVTSFICGLMQIGSDTIHWKNAMDKYKVGVKPPVVSNLSPYVLNYIRAQESNRK
jgi:hypothetical protein